MKIFANRSEAGWALGEVLAERGFSDSVVLGIPRGGVVVAAAVAEALGATLDVVVPRKIGAPHNPELGLGAVAEGVEFVDEDMVRRAGASPEYLAGEIAAQRSEVARRAKAYRGGRGSAEIAGRQVIVVDDGIATGGTAIASLRWARARGAEWVILAVPVMPAGMRARLEAEADQVIALAEPDTFYAVGQFYIDFRQTSDDEVVRLLSAAATG